MEKYKFLLACIILFTLFGCYTSESLTETFFNENDHSKEYLIYKSKERSICYDCWKEPHIADSSICKMCGKYTESSSFSLCRKCAITSNTCAKCRGPIDLNVYLNKLQLSHIGSAMNEQKDCYPVQAVKLCPACQKWSFSVELHKCRNCSNLTSVSFIFCAKCSVKEHVCQRCGRPEFSF